MQDRGNGTTMLVASMHTTPVHAKKVCLNLSVRVKETTGHDSTVPKVPGSGVGSADKYTVNGRGTAGKRVSWQEPVESRTA